jgi:hypothetical protein
MTGGKDACDGLMMREDNVEAGAVLTTTTMTTTTGIAAEMPDGVRDELKALLQRDEVDLPPSEVVASPLLGSGSAWGGPPSDAGPPRRAYDDGPRAWIDAYEP